MVYRRVLLFLLLAFVLGGCQGIEEILPTPTPTLQGVPMTIQVSSQAFTNGGTIPDPYTCDFDNISPALAWSNVPAETQSLVLVVEDPDAPVGIWIHWILYNLPPDLRSLPEKVKGIGVTGENSFRKNEYGGPCPPPGKPHRYFFRIYALDTVLALEEGETQAELLKAMQGHILAYGELVGMYGRDQ